MSNMLKIIIKRRLAELGERAIPLAKRHGYRRDLLLPAQIAENPSIDTLKKMATCLNLDLKVLTGDLPYPGASPGERMAQKPPMPPPSQIGMADDMSLAGFNLRARPLVPVSVPDDGFTIRDLPVYGAAMGGHVGGNRVTIINPDPVEYIRRPDPLKLVTNAFAIYVSGDSMTPAFDPGDIVLVNPNRRPRRGNYVLLVDDRDHAAWRGLIKKYIKETESAWLVEQHNPAKTLEIPIEEYNACFVIVGSYRT